MRSMKIFLCIEYVALVTFINSVSNDVRLNIVLLCIYEMKCLCVMCKMLWKIYEMWNIIINGDIGTVYNIITLR